MKKYTAILIFIVLSTKGFALSIISYPLNIMIDNSEFIIKGVVVNVFKTDSSLDKQLKQEIPYKVFTCGGYAKNTARVKIITRLKGQIIYDTILIPFESSVTFDIPCFKQNDTCILFVNKLNINKYYGKTRSRDGVKFSNTESYQKAIEKYQLIIKQHDSLQNNLKLNWLIDLASSRDLTCEGSESLKRLPVKVFDKIAREKMSNALTSSTILEHKQENLLEIVSHFGFNHDLILLCIKNIEYTISDTRKSLYIANDLMRAINKMDPRKHYEKQIKKFSKYSSYSENGKEKQYKVLTSFVEEAIKNYSQQ